MQDTVDQAHDAVPPTLADIIQGARPGMEGGQDGARSQPAATSAAIQPQCRVVEGFRLLSSGLPCTARLGRHGNEVP
jgi:hypothetical protein